MTEKKFKYCEECNTKQKCITLLLEKNIDLINLLEIAVTFINVTIPKILNDTGHYKNKKEK